MEYSQKNDNPNPLLCFQYQINPLTENKVNLISNYNTFLGKLNQKYPSLQQIKMKEQNTEDYDEYIKLDDKRNYDEIDLFSMQNIGKILMMKRKLPPSQLPQPTQQSKSQIQQLPQSQQRSQSTERDNIIRNNLNFPNDYTLNNLNGNDNHNEATIDFLPNMIPKTNDTQPSLPGGEDIDKLIVLFPQLSDIKTKAQTIKKFIAYYKKNKYDERKITPFFMSLSSQINESSTETKFWIHYEYLKTRLESHFTAICKEMGKLINALKSNNVTLGNGDTISIFQASKKIIINKIKEYFNSSEEEEKIGSKPFIHKFLDNYNPTRGKKKEVIGFYKERLNKKIKEMFKKNEMPITDEKISSFFFQPALNIETNENNNYTTTFNNEVLNSLNDKNSFNNSINNSSRQLEDEKEISNSHNSNVNAYNTTNNINVGMGVGNNNKNSINLSIPSNFVMQQKTTSVYHKKTSTKTEPRYSSRFKIKQFSEEDF